MYSVDNAIIMAAGISSRFAPLSYEKPKALIEVHGEVLIERQIRQLREVGIYQIIVVTGYKAEQFAYLKDKFDIQIVHNPEYMRRNNHASLFVAREYLKNTYICSADNYFVENPFESNVSQSYYAGVYAKGETKEWCVYCDDSDRIVSVKVGGVDAWYMMGHAFFDSEFSWKFRMYLEQEYNCSETIDMFWEDIYIKHIDVLNMKIRKYNPGIINEFDSLDELRQFDHTYIENTRSKIVERIAHELKCKQSEIVAIMPVKRNECVMGFEFTCRNQQYKWLYGNNSVERVSE